MTIITENIGGSNFPRMERGNLYSFSYINLSDTTEKKILNPVIVFSGVDDKKRIHGLNIMALRDGKRFLDTFFTYYWSEGRLKDQFKRGHKFSFKPEVLNSIFGKTNPDALSCWRFYIPNFMKNIKYINMIEAYNIIRTPVKTLNKKSGPL